MEAIKQIIDYLLFRDMGELGGGCIISLFIYAVIIWFTVCIVALI